jgi:NAD(P)-dependent dehydrogenase (short-subunit alcohol dehydrogenase family)
MRRRAGWARTVLITGGASGLGAALAAGYAARGAQVLVTDRTPPGRLPKGARYQRLDITSESDWADALARVRDEFGELDLLINNAGIAAGGRVDRLDADHWRRVFEVNVLGAVNGCRTFTPMFKGQGHGHIVNVASMAGLVHPAAMSSYNGSKAAVVAFSETLRHELAPYGIDTTVVCPSFFRSNLASSLGGDDPLMDAVAAKLISRAPLDAPQIAARVIRGVDARKFLVLPDRAGRVAYWTKRMARPMYDRRMLDSGARFRLAELEVQSALPIARRLT